MMQKLFCTIAAIAFFTTYAFHPSYASGEKYPPFPLNQTVMTMGFGGSDDIAVNVSCRVDKNDTEGMYSYTIVFDYENNKNKRLLSWNFLDWILSNYPKAIKEKWASPHLFPLIDEGNYTFNFKSAEAPIWFERTVIRIFPQESAEAETERLEQNKESAEYSGVSVSSYNYIKTHRGFGASSCLPPSLLVFPQNLRSGF